MNTGIEARIDAGVDASALGATAVIGLVSESEFPDACAAMPELTECGDYQEWLDFREGLQMSLAMAGVDARIATIPLSAFLAWCSAAGTTPTEQSLDAYAELRSPPPEARRAKAVGDSAEFRRCPEAVGAAARYQN